MSLSENGRRKEEAVHSPRYFAFENRKYPDARSSRSDWREHGRLVHRALKIIAGYDSDHAHFANGKGFSKSDVRDGHWYAGIDENSFAASSQFPKVKSLCSDIAVSCHPSFAIILTCQNGIKNKFYCSWVAASAENPPHHNRPYQPSADKLKASL